MGRNPCCRGLRKFLKHLPASDLRLFGIAAIQGVGPFGMLDLHCTMEDIAENDDSLLARCYQQRCVTGGMPWGSGEPLLRVRYTLPPLRNSMRCSSRIQHIGYAGSTLRLIVEAVPLSAPYQIACIREGQDQLAIDLAH